MGFGKAVVAFGALALTGATDTSLISTIECTASGPVEVVVSLRTGAIVARKGLPAGISIAHAWADPTPGGASFSEAYLTIFNNGPADRLVRATSRSAATVKFGALLTEQAAGAPPSSGLVVPANSKLTLGVNDPHLVLLDLRLSLDVGEVVPVTLFFAGAGEKQVLLPVLSSSAAALHAHA
ncbi:MAG TPA: copper chaperone PCu(A)C [Hyphomicrobiaceae bacterium]|nr:copper chaperone PCu(A)C [Hyphomicrobiaceae bacterium]